VIVAHDSFPELGIDLFTDILHHPEADGAGLAGSLGGMGLIYKPFAVVIGILGGFVGRKVFEFVWTKIDDEEPPGALTEQTTWGKLIAVAALEGLIFRVVRYVIERHGAMGFRYLTGIWPGEKRPDPD
jgi:hypothetical protein